jgi:hypothetical protein
VPDRIRKVLDHLVANYVVRDEQLDIDLSAPAAEPGDAIASSKERVASRETRRADELAGDFHRALVEAYRARAAGRSELVLDDRQPDQDRMADALIRFLVSFDLASSRSEETEPMRYRYAVSIDWPKLNAAAGEAGVDLEATLRDLAARRDGG